jgi:hypothetical protein
MKKLFENVEGNRFKLLTESVNGEEYVISGLKKVFGSGLNEISYHRVEAVGLGYIKDVSTAQRISLQEAKRIAESFGYKDDETNAKFIKEEDRIDGPRNSLGVDPEPENIANHHNKLGVDPEEKREVEIARQILQIIDSPGMDRVMETEKGLLRTLAKELLQMHGGKA